MADLEREWDVAKANLDERNRKVDQLVGAIEALELRGQKLGLAADGATRARRMFETADLTRAIEEVKAGHPAAAKASSWDGVPVDYRLDDVSPYLRDRLRVASLLPTSATELPSVAIFRATAAADQAAVAEPGSLKPESAPGWEEMLVPTFTVAHTTTVQNQLLADVPTALSIINGEMVAGLVAAENDLLLNGDAAHIAGLIASAGARPILLGPSEPYGEAIHRGVTALRTGVFAEPDGIVIHPSDLETLRFAKASGSGEYLVGDALAPDAGTLWGVRVIVTTRIPEGQALVANFAIAARFYVRQTPTVELNPWGAADDFLKNLTRIRVEERIGLGVVRPQALCVVDFALS